MFPSCSSSTLREKEIILIPGGKLRFSSGGAAAGAAAGAVADREKRDLLLI